MKQVIFSTLVTVALLAVPISQASADHNHHGYNLLSNENIGRAIGTGLGAYLGTKVGRGRGNDVAIAAGAVGGFVLGGKVGRNWGGNKHAHARHANHHSHQYAAPRRAKSKHGYLEPVQAMPELLHIDSPYRANRTSNVRGGPSMKYKIVEGLKQGEEVWVLGRVADTNWFMIAQYDIIQGFVHMSLLDPIEDQYSYHQPPPETPVSYTGSDIQYCEPLEQASETPSQGRVVEIVEGWHTSPDNQNTYHGDQYPGAYCKN